MLYHPIRRDVIEVTYSKKKDKAFENIKLAY